ncbi:hypothetical protein IMSAG049_00324 [Clostridiales bacterium]|nr:hypothetical protein IMSAG049_00324 [Clostridiales bacterium]
MPADSSASAWVELFFYLFISEFTMLVVSKSILFACKYNNFETILQEFFFYVRYNFPENMIARKGYDNNELTGGKMYNDN